MESATTLVIKVKYGDMLRRFNASVVDQELDFNMDGLVDKVFSLFKFAPETDLILTYVDEDGDMVTLVDDDDLRDAVKQALNPLRITVKLKTEKNGQPPTRSSGTSTPLRSPRVQQPTRDLTSSVPEILNTIPEPLRETLVKLSTDLVSKVSASAPGIAPGATDLINYFSKVGLSYIDQISESQNRVQPGTKNDVPESRSAAVETKDSEVSKVDKVPSNGGSEKSSPELKPESSTKNNEVKVSNVSEATLEAPSSEAPGFNDVAPGLDSKNIIVDLHNKYNSPDSASMHLKEKLYGRIGKKEKSKKIIASRHFGKSGESFTEKEINKPSEPHLGPKPANSGALPGGFNHFSGSVSDSNLSYQNPISGSPAQNISPGSQRASFRRSGSQKDSGMISHHGVRCDGCGVLPITGPRFKSKVKTDFDLCSLCFEQMGIDSEYIRMDCPAAFRNRCPFRGLNDIQARNRIPPLPEIDRNFYSMFSGILDSRFIKDVNITDGTVMAPLTQFTKIWRLRNCGTAVWPQGTLLVFHYGDKMSSTCSVEVEIPAAGLAVDQEVDVAVDFISPELPGRYVSHWKMASPSGQQFGQRIWVLIEVIRDIQQSPHVGLRGWNLNLPPPPNSVLTGPEIINVNLEPTMEFNTPLPEPDSSNKTVKIMTDNEQEIKFPITDTLLVGTGAPTASSSVSYPIIDPIESPLPNPASHVPYPRAPNVFYPIIPPPPPPPPPRLFDSLPKQDDDFEVKLLRELDEMGFKQVDLNKEILRMHDYDLGQTVDDLCGVAEWDPILEELREMGFRDTEMNRSLLKKNNGSIKRVVMDLIAGEDM